jgi:hypothetical protein
MFQCNPCSNLKDPSQKFIAKFGVLSKMMYCKTGNVREHFIFVISKTAFTLATQSLSCLFVIVDQGLPLFYWLPVATGI